MIAAVDLYGVAAIIAACGTAAGTILGGIAVVRTGKIHDQLKTGNGHTVGENSAAARKVADKLGVIEDDAPKSEAS